MIYDIEVAGPKGFQVSIVCGQPASRWLVADFGSLESAEAFVDAMRQLDTAAPHTRRAMCGLRATNRHADDEGTTPCLRVGNPQEPTEASRNPGSRRQGSPKRARNIRRC